MKISELQARQGNVELTAQVVSIETPRSFNKFGKEGKVANAKLKDDSGEVTLTLWNEQCDQVKPGDTVAIHNGWVSEYRGELQLSTGKFGQLELVTGGAATKVTLASAPLTPAPTSNSSAASHESGAKHAVKHAQTPASSAPVQVLPRSAQASLVGVFSGIAEPEFTTADKYTGSDGIGAGKSGSGEGGGKPDDDFEDEPFDDTGGDSGGDDFD